MPALWPHQTEALEALRNEFRSGKRRVVLCAPTGSGKTVVAAEMIRGALAQGGRVVFVADPADADRPDPGRSPRYFLRLREVAGGEHAQRGCAGSGRVLGDDLGPAGFGVFPGGHPGVSGDCGRGPHDRRCRPGVGRERRDPDGRADGDPVRPMKEFWDSVVSARTTRKLVGDGVLVPLEVWCLPGGGSVRVGVSSTGEWKTGEVSPGLSRWSGMWSGTADPVREGGPDPEDDRLLGLGQSRRGSAGPVQRGRIPVRAGLLCGPLRADREAKIEGLRKGDLHGLISVDALAKGFDVVDIECVVVARRSGGVWRRTSRCSAGGCGRLREEALHRSRPLRELLPAGGRLPRPSSNTGLTAWTAGRRRMASGRRIGSAPDAGSSTWPAPGPASGAGRNSRPAPVEEVGGSLRKFDGAEAGTAVMGLAVGAVRAGGVLLCVHGDLPEASGGPWPSRLTRRARRPSGPGDDEEMTGRWLSENWGGSMENVRRTHETLLGSRAMDPDLIPGALEEMSFMGRAFARRAARAEGRA